jgi:formylmethanofuran dehydrogenase subunit E
MKKMLRTDIEKLIKNNNLKGLLNKAGELHGHLCSYLTYGVLAGHIAVKELKIKCTGMEEAVAIVETNNCFSDGIQVVTGCTFGNNSLIYKDFGKTAVTAAKRDGTAIRVALDPDFEDSREAKYPEASEYWDKVIVKREEVSSKEHEKMMRLFAEMALQELDEPIDKMFRIEHLKVTVPDYAPIFNSVKCSICGEKIMESRARVKDGKPICITCGKVGYNTVDGRGISTSIS